MHPKLAYIVNQYVFIIEKNNDVKIFIYLLYMENNVILNVLKIRWCGLPKMTSFIFVRSSKLGQCE